MKRPASSGDDRPAPAGFGERLRHELFRPWGRTRPIYLFLGGAFVYACLAGVVQWGNGFFPAFLAGVYIAVFVRDAVRSIAGALVTLAVCAPLVDWLGIPEPTGTVGIVSYLPFWILQVALGGLGALVGSLHLGFGEHTGHERFFTILFLSTILLLFAHAALRAESRMQWLQYHPQAGQYRFDAALYLRTFYLLERNEGFYDAMARAIDEDARDIAVTFPQNVRLPTLFWVWSFFLPSNGIWIWRLYLLLSLFTIYTAYKALRQVGAVQRAVGWMGAVALMPYLLAMLRSPYVVFPEPWAIIPTVVAFSWYVHKKRGRAAFAGVAAALTREIYGFVCLAGFLTSAVNRKWKRTGVYAGAILVLLALYGLHVQVVTERFSLQSDFGTALGQWAHLPEENDTPVTYSATLFGHFSSASSFAIGLYPFGQRRGDFPSEAPVPWNEAPVRYLVLAMALLGTWKMRNPQNRWFAWGLVLLPILLVTFSSPHPRWGEYWGMTFMPMALLLSPLALRKRGPAFPPPQGKRPSLWSKLKPRSTP